MGERSTFYDFIRWYEEYSYHAPDCNSGTRTPEKEVVPDANPPEMALKGLVVRYSRFWICLIGESGRQSLAKCNMQFRFILFCAAHTNALISHFSANIPPYLLSLPFLSFTFFTLTYIPIPSKSTAFAPRRPSFIDVQLADSLF